MIQPLEIVKAQISRTDQQLMYHLIMEQQETNRLLRQIIGEKNPIDELKRPELMKRIAQLENKPTGWNKWGTEDMRNYLKEAK